MRRQAHKGGDASFQQVHDNDAHHEDRQPVGIEQLVQQIKETADKLIRDQRQPRRRQAAQHGPEGAALRLQGLRPVSRIAAR